MFMGPYEGGGDFSDRGISGVVRFLNRVWQLALRHEPAAQEPGGEAKRAMHITIKRVTEDIAALKYNTAIAALMEYLHTLEEREDVTRTELETLLRLLAPLAPYITEELWERLGHQTSIHTASWPIFDAASIQSQMMTILVQVNGRVRDRIEVSSTASEDEVKRQALNAGKAQRFVAGQNVSRVVYVPARLVNIVTA